MRTINVYYTCAYVIQYETIKTAGIEELEVL